MAITATTAGFSNTGHDLAVTLVSADGGAVEIENLMQFDSRQITKDITRYRLDNSVLVADLPSHWEGTLHFDRGTGATDNFISDIEAAWKAGFDYDLGTMKFTISTKGAPAGFTFGGPTSDFDKQFSAKAGVGAITTGGSTITFFDVSVRMDEGGTWRGDDVTTCRLTFRAAVRAVTGGPGGAGAGNVGAIG